MSTSYMSTDLFLATAEKYTDFRFAPEIIMRENAFSPCLRLVDSMDVFISINQLEILKATIGAFLEAEKEKAEEAEAEARNEAIRATISEDTGILAGLL